MTHQRVDPSFAKEAPAGQGGQLVAVVVGIDRYADPQLPELRCAVNDAETITAALQHTANCPPAHVQVLALPAKQTQGYCPTKARILDALRRAAQIARAESTMLFFFAGHGLLIEQRPYLVPYDARISDEEKQRVAERLLSLEEIEAVFSKCPVSHRIMFLDCCQVAGSLPGDSIAASPPRANEASHMADWVRVAARQLKGWILVLSCSPGEQSLEDVGWGQHGIFSHFLAEGLRGQADLNGDGIVSLAELVQYLADRVPKQAEAVILEARTRGQPVPPQHSQHPLVIWNGPIHVPIVRFRPEQRTGFQWTVFPLWGRYLIRPTPFGVPLEMRARAGGSLLYGLAMGLSVLLFGFPALPHRWGWLAAAIALASALLLNASIALAGAANAIRWHSGGYRASETLLLWHMVVFAVSLAGRNYAGAAIGPQAVFSFAVVLFIIICLVVVFATNAANCLISLADLLQRNERVALRRAFVQLDDRWIQADIPNVIAMVSGHPKLYQILGLVCCLLLAAHAAWVIVAGTLSLLDQLVVARNAVLVVMVQWFVQWYAAAYRGIKGRLLSEK